MVGRVFTRMSTSRSLSFILIRPSCGIRLSTISRCAMTFIREMTESLRSFGIVSTLWSRPSILIRMIVSVAVGSICISEQLSVYALINTEFTRRIVGPSSSFSMTGALTTSSVNPDSSRICAIASATPTFSYRMFIA